MERVVRPIVGEVVQVTVKILRQECQGSQKREVLQGHLNFHEKVFLVERENRLEDIFVFELHHVWLVGPFITGGLKNKFQGQGWKARSTNLFQKWSDGKLRIRMPNDVKQESVLELLPNFFPHLLGKGRRHR